MTQRTTLSPGGRGVGSQSYGDNFLDKYNVRASQQQDYNSNHGGSYSTGYGSHATRDPYQPPAPQPYRPQDKMSSRAPPVRPSELLRGQPTNSSGLVTGGSTWGARYRIPDHEIQSNNEPQNHYSSGVDTGERILPSQAFSREGDVLDKYKIKDDSEQNSDGTITWVIMLNNIPSGSGLPVELIVGGISVFSGVGSNGVVNISVSSTVSANSAGTPFMLKVPSAAFVFQRNLLETNGRFVRFAVEPSAGMKFRQQKTEFTD